MLIAWWPLNGDTKDYSGNGNDATNNGAVLDSSGKIGQCYNFNGSNNSVNIPAGSLGTYCSSLTVSAWVNVTSMNASGVTTPIFHNWNTWSVGSQKGFALRSYDGAKFEFVVCDGTNYSSLNFISSAQVGTWTHIVGVFDSGKMKVYTNGSLTNSSNPGYAGVTIEQTTSYIGKGLINTGYLNGKVNDVRFYDHALSDKEVYDLSKAKILHYTFNDFQEPTTNLFTNYITAIFSNAYNGINYGFGSGTDLQEVVDNSNYIFDNCAVTKVSRITGGTSQKDYICNNISSELNSTKVISFWYYGTFGSTISPYNNDGSASLYYLDNTGSWVGGSTSINVPVPVRQWIRIVLKMVNKGSLVGTGLSWMILHNDTITATLSNNEYWLFTGWQIEQKDHATPFVNGSRTGVITDCSGYGNNAVLDTYTPQWVNNSQLGSGCYSLDGINQYFNVNSIKDVNYSTGMTYCIWAYPRSIKNWARFFDVGIASQNENIALTRNGTTNNLYLEVKNGTSNGTSVQANVIELNKWQHFAFTIDSLGNAKLYKNGNPVASGTVTIPHIVSRVNSFIGRSNWSADAYYDGLFDDIRLYVTALSDQDIKDLYEVRGSLDKSGNLYVNQLAYKFPKNAYEIKQQYPNAKSGIYTIQPDPNSEPFEAYCDMDTAGGGWTLLVCTTSISGWNTISVKNRNMSTPSINSNYSILDKADLIKSNIGDNLQFRFDAVTMGRYGGVYSAPYSYTFMKTDNTQTNITQILLWDGWVFNTGARMPWLGSSCGLLTMSSIACTNWWNTIVSDQSFSPAPWMPGGPTDPGIIWYWVR